MISKVSNMNKMIWGWSLSTIYLAFYWIKIVHSKLLLLLNHWSLRKYKFYHHIIAHFTLICKAYSQIEDHLTIISVKSFWDLKKQPGFLLIDYYLKSEKVYLRNVMSKCSNFQHLVKECSNFKDVCINTCLSRAWEEPGWILEC